MFTIPSKSVKFPKGDGSTEIINGYKRFGFPNWGGGEGKIDGSHILIIALSEHHVDYMSRKGWSLRYYAGGGGILTDVYIGKHGLVLGARVLANSDFHC